LERHTCPALTSKVPSGVTFLYLPFRMMLMKSLAWSWKNLRSSDLTQWWRRRENPRTMIVQR